MEIVVYMPVGIGDALLDRWADDVSGQG